MSTQESWFDTEDLPVSDHEKASVDKGLAEIAANPNGGMTSGEFWSRIKVENSR